MSTGGLGDKNFNDMSYEGMEKAQNELWIEFDYVEPKSISDFSPQIRIFAESGEYDLIIAVGNDQSEAIIELSEEFPDQKFLIIDASVEKSNVSSIFTKWSEQTFLAGVVAGLGIKESTEKSNAENIVGVVLGMDSPILREGLAGFASGVKYVNPDAEILQATVGAFNDPGKGKETALSMYNRGADFIQHIAGASGLGVFNAAKEANKYVFGVGGNQNAEAPDYIVGTSVRNVATIVFSEVEKLIKGEWTAGVRRSGLEEGAVGYSSEGSNIVLPQEIETILEEVRLKIVNGELIPCEDIDGVDTWTKNNQYKPSE